MRWEDADSAASWTHDDTLRRIAHESGLYLVLNDDGFYACGDSYSPHAPIFTCEEPGLALIQQLRALRTSHEAIRRELARYESRYGVK